MKNNLKQLIIIAGGASIKEGIEKQLWEKLKNRFTVGLNYSYHFFEATCQMYVDSTFYNEIKKDWDKIPLIIGQGRNIKERPSHSLVIPCNAKYNRELNDGVYSGSLVGLYALSLGIYLLDVGEIFLCYDNQTEVFTDSGWKYFKDLDKEKDLILTRKSSGETEWSKILEKQQYHYTGLMKHIQSRGIDLLVTPEHKFCLESIADYSNKYCSKKPAKDGYFWKTIDEFTTSNYFIPRTFIWRGIKNENFILNNIKIDMNDWCRFLGLYLSEGCYAEANTKYYTKKHVIIYQNHTQEKDSYILSILNKLPFKYIKHKREWYIYNDDLVNYVKQFGKAEDKFIPREILNLDVKYLSNLLESLIFGDGFKQKKSLNYITISKKLADDVQEIAMKLNYYAEIYYRKGRMCKLSKTKKIGRPIWQVYINNSKKQGNLSKISVKGLKVRNCITEKSYNDMIYDITVKNHTLFVRRNNKCVWAGNCGYDYGSIDTKLDDKNRKITHFYQDKISHRGVGKTSWYDSKNRADKDFGVYKEESQVKIYNVSINSKINTFEKIDYDTFFSKLDTKQYDQNELRNFIKERLHGKLQ